MNSFKNQESFIYNAKSQEILSIFEKKILMKFQNENLTKQYQDKLIKRSKNIKVKEYCKNNEESCNYEVEDIKKKWYLKLRCNLKKSQEKEEKNKEQIEQTQKLGEKKENEKKKVEINYNLERVSQIYNDDIEMNFKKQIIWII